MTAINRDEWLKALSEAGVPQDDDQSAVTVAEFAAMFSLPRMTASRRLEKLAAAGKATKTKKRALDPNGRMFTMLAYRLT